MQTYYQIQKVFVKRAFKASEHLRVSEVIARYTRSGTLNSTMRSGGMPSESVNGLALRIM